MLTNVRIPERYHSEVDRERAILDAAAAAFYEKGFHGVGVDELEDRSLTDPWRRHFNHRRKQYVARWEAIVARCVPGAAPAEVAALTQSILGLIFSIAYWPPQTAEVTGLAELIVAFTSRGLSGIRA